MICSDKCSFKDEKCSIAIIIKFLLLIKKGSDDILYYKKEQRSADLIVFFSFLLKPRVDIWLLKNKTTASVNL